MKKVHYRKYDLISTEGSPGDCAYMIDEGRIAIIAEKNIHLAILSTNAIFGKMALIAMRKFAPLPHLLLKTASYQSSPQRRFTI